MFRYFKYIIFAKHRKGHGIHSPFLFHFISKVIFGNHIDLNSDNFYRIQSKDFVLGLKRKYKNLLFRLIQYFKIENIFELKSYNDLKRIKSISELILLDFKDDSLLSFTNLSFFLENNANECVIIKGAHNSKRSEKVWRTIKKNKNVKVTLDLYFLCILLFKKELNKQNYIIRY